MRRLLVGSILAFSVLGLGCSSSEEGEGGTATILFFQAAPPTIDPGMTAVLRWDVRNAGRLQLTTVDGEAIPLDAEALGAREVEVRPEETTGYRLTAYGKGGGAVHEEARVSVRTNLLRIASFEASSASILEGETVTLSWTTENAVGVRLYADGNEIPLGDAEAEAGSVEHRPSRTTTYTLRATNPAEVREATARVEVQRGLDVELTADRSLIPFGESTTLRWRARSASRIDIRSGAQVLVDGSTEPSGSIEVTPTKVTTYEVTAHGEEGTATDSTRVRVAPVIADLSPTGEGPWPRGASIELNWEVRGAEGVQLTSNDGWSFDGGAIGQVETVVPLNGSFHLRAWLDDEEVSQNLTVPILERPEVSSFTVTPSAITLDEGEATEVRFAWSSLRSAHVAIRDEGGVILAEGPAIGEADVLLDRGGIFTLTAENAAGTASRLAELKTYLPPLIHRLTARPSHVGSGEPFEISWDGRATMVELERGGIPVFSGPGGTGSRVVQVAGETTFLLRAANELGAIVEEEITVTVGPPRILDFEADRLRHGPGSSVQFSWTALGGTSLEVTAPGGLGCNTSDLDSIAEGSCSITLPTTPGPLQFTLTVTNGLLQKDTEVIEVEVVDGPAILDFHADKSRITLGDSLTFFWTTGVDADNRTPSLELTENGTSVPLGAADPLSGSASVTPSAAGTRTFRLTATTPDTTEAVREVQVEVLEAPTVVLIPPPAPYVPGEGPVELGWTTDHAAEVEVFELDGGSETSLALFVDPLLVAGGSLELHPPGPGADYRVVARNDLGHEVDAEIYISWAVPEIDLFQALPPSVSLRGTTNLQWSATDESSVEILPRPLRPTEPFLDLGEVPSSSELSLGSCGASQLPGEACATANLPFAYPFGGQLFNQVRILKDGALGFDMGYAGGFAGEVELPSAAASHVALAPFWQPLKVSVPGDAREGRILFHTDTDLRGQFAIVQWDGFWSEDATAGAPADLNFQVVLRDDGSFEFRYGRMEAAAHPGLAEGAEASIGYQLPGGVEGQSISFHAAVDSGLADLAFALHMGELAAAGSLDALILFLGEQTFELTALNGAGSVQESVIVTGFEGVQLHSIAVVEEFPVAGQPFTLTWTAVNADEVRVELPPVDPEDPTEIPVVLCTVPAGASQLCSITEPAPGAYTYFLRGLGQGQDDRVLEIVEVEVLPVFSIDDFSVSSPSIFEGEEVTISWSTTGAETIGLEANGSTINVSSFSPLAGSLDIVLTEDTTFEFTAHSHGRTLTETVEVEVEEPPGDGGSGGSGGSGGAGGAGGAGGSP